MNAPFESIDFHSDPHIFRLPDSSSNNSNWMAWVAVSIIILVGGSIAFSQYQPKNTSDEKKN